MTAARRAKAIHRPMCHMAAAIPVTVNATLTAAIPSE
jgi:hypothetical protein